MHMGWNAHKPPSKTYAGYAYVGDIANGEGAAADIVFQVDDGKGHISQKTYRAYISNTADFSPQFELWEQEFKIEVTSMGQYYKEVGNKISYLNQEQFQKAIWLDPKVENFNFNHIEDVRQAIGKGEYGTYQNRTNLNNYVSGGAGVAAAFFATGTPVGWAVCLFTGIAAGAQFANPNYLRVGNRVNLFPRGTF